MKNFRFALNSWTPLMVGLSATMILEKSPLLTKVCNNKRKISKEISSYLDLVTHFDLKINNGLDTRTKIH